MKIINSKNTLAKVLVGKNGYYKPVLIKINNSLEKFDQLYKNIIVNDEKQKFTRMLFGDLKVVNKLINDKILKGYDKNLPSFIFGGVSGKNHIDALKNHSKNSVGSAILLDFTRYFENIPYDLVVESLIYTKIANKKGAKLIADLSCVDVGKKERKGGNRVIARGFNTSSRLAIIASLKFFKKLDWLIKDHFKGLNPKLSVYVDDIIISFDNTNDEKIYDFLEDLYELSKENKLPFNKNKEKIIRNGAIQSLGLIQLKGKTSVTKEFKRGLGNDYKELHLGNKEKIKIIKGKLNYKKQVKKGNT